MENSFHQRIVPMPVTTTEDVLVVHQLAIEFRDELHMRDAFEHYCVWYQQISTEHQQALTAMRAEFNPLRWRRSD